MHIPSAPAAAPHLDSPALQGWASAAQALAEPPRREVHASQPAQAPAHLRANATTFNYIEQY